VFFPSVTYGITDNITMGGGMSLFPPRHGQPDLFLHAKAGFRPAPDFSLAAGALIVRVPRSTWTTG